MKRKIRTSFAPLLLTSIAFAQDQAALASTVPRLVNFAGTMRGAGGKPVNTALPVTFALFCRAGGRLRITVRNTGGDAGRVGPLVGLSWGDKSQWIAARSLHLRRSALGRRPSRRARRDGILVTPNRDRKCLYVTKKTSRGFEVHELAGGHASIAFDYRVGSRWNGYETVRLADKMKEFERAKLRRNAKAVAKLTNRN